MVAGSGIDTVYGGSGNDEIKGDSGNDNLDGGDGVSDTAVYSGLAPITSPLIIWLAIPSQCLTARQAAYRMAQILL